MNTGARFSPLLAATLSLSALLILAPGCGNAEDPTGPRLTQPGSSQMNGAVSEDRHWEADPLRAGANGRANLPPETWASAPSGGTIQSGETVSLFWSGWDSDGEVAGFQWRMKSGGRWSPWFWTASNDSTFQVDAPRGWWVFAIRAVDNEGAVDRSIARVRLRVVAPASTQGGNAKGKESSSRG